MKKTLLAAATLALSTNAIASQVRFDSLQGARTTKQDFVEMFSQPSTMWSGEIADQVLFENNSGGVIISGEGSRYGFYVGRQSDLQATQEWTDSLNGMQYSGLPGTGADARANAVLNRALGTLVMPVTAFYGRESGSIKWGLAATIVNSKQTNAPVNFEQNAMSLAGGVDGGNWRVDASVGLAANFSTAGSAPAMERQLEGQGNNRIQAEYDISEAWRAYADVSNAGFERSVGGTVNQEVRISRTSVGAERRMDHGMFYGLRYDMFSSEVGGTKTDSTSLPVHIGGEVEASDWMVLRAAWSQSLMSTRREAGGQTVTQTLAGDTVVTGGAGIRIGKSLIDVTTGIASGSNMVGGRTVFAQGGGDLFANVAYTYNF